MEYLDLLDEKGNPTGEKRERQQVHIEGLWHRGVNVWIVNSKGEILLQKRSPNKAKHPNMWHISCAGHVIAGDTPMDTCIKELKEELGVTVSKEQVQYLFTVKKESNPKLGYLEREFDDIYLLPIDLDLEKDVVLDLEETTKVKYIPIQEYRRMIQNKVKDIIIPTYIEKLIQVIEEKGNKENS